ncbi:DUF2723 domain-containing protein [candidate division FCPU426 bacterium]|nr:DUF2723 domain-containing protein [candidate division FCPU426 bacterium]
MRIQIGTESSGQAGAPSRLDPLFAVFTFIFPVILSLPLLGTDLLGGQQAELVLGSSTLGIVRFPGFPLYLLTTKIISFFVPHPSEIWRIHFTNLCYSASACLFLFLCGRRLHFPPIVSLAAAWLFFFSPVVWQQTLLLHYPAFHLLLLAALVYATLGLLGPMPQRKRQLRLHFWAFFCGLCGGQHPSLLPWAIAVLVVGMTLVLHRQRAKMADYSLIFIMVLAGLLLPYLYLPLRILSPQAFVNTDTVSASALYLAPTAADVLAWLLQYFKEGFVSFYVTYSLHASLFKLWDKLLALVKAYPLFPLLLVALGLLLNLRSAFVKQSRRSTEKVAPASRLLLVVLPLCALGGEVLLLPDHAPGTKLTLSLGFAFWGLKGLEYCYQVLGHPDEALAKNQRLPPTWFAYFIILIIPALVFIQNFETLKKYRRYAGDSRGTLKNMELFLKDLPAQALVVFPTVDFYMTAGYLQRRLQVRKDLLLKPFSSPWPEAPPTAAGPLPVPGQQQPDRVTKTLASSRSWIQGLNKKLQSGRPVFVLFSAFPPNPGLQYLIQSFSLIETHPPVLEWIQTDSWRMLSVYRIRPRPSPPQPLVAGLAKTYINDYENQLRLVSAQLQRPLKRRGSFSLLQVSLQWQLLQQVPTNNLLVYFWITPAVGPKSIRLQDGKRAQWKERRFLGRGHDLRQHPVKTIFRDHYQFVVPAELPAGRYQVHISVVDKETNQALLAGAPLGEAVYFASACEFWVVDREKGAGASLPYAYPSSVPRK